MQTSSAAARLSWLTFGLMRTDSGLFPDGHECWREGLNRGVVVKRRRADAQTFGSPRSGGIIDRLDVSSMLFEEEIGCTLAGHRIAGEYWTDMCLGRHDGQSSNSQPLLHARCPSLMSLTQPAILLQTANSSPYGRSRRRR